ncbi:MAG: potassium transporter, partial [Haliea sp.]
MHLTISMRILGLLLMLFSSTLLVPMGFALLDDDHTITSFASALGLTFLAALLLWRPGQHVRHQLRM